MIKSNVTSIGPEAHTLAFLINMYFEHSFSPRQVADAKLAYVQIPKHCLAHKRGWTSPPSGPSEEHLADVYSCAVAENASSQLGGQESLIQTYCHLKKIRERASAADGLTISNNSWADSGE